MRSLLLQIASVTMINLKSIPQRLWLSLSTVMAVALVVVVLLSFLAMANGFQRTIEGSGAKDVAVLLRDGATAELNSVVMQDQVRLIEEAPGIARNAAGKPRTVTIVPPKRFHRGRLSRQASQRRAITAGRNWPNMSRNWGK